MAAERSARIDAEIEALAREKERYKAEAAAMEKERQMKSPSVDRRELPLVNITDVHQHMQIFILLRQVVL